jgi:hypothetical protein
MTVPGYTAGFTLYGTGEAHTSIAVRARMPVGMVMVQQDPCAISTDGSGSPGYKPDCTTLGCKRPGDICCDCNVPAVCTTPARCKVICGPGGK